jgi:DNA-directed RNA polymerase subunit M/transcription elongation factor TFIIS
MENQALSVETPTEITFNCRHCKSALVVGAAAAGLVLDCRRCGKPTPVPRPQAATVPTEDTQTKLADLQHRMKENESQRTEIASYINQHSIQLHRWQLRLQTLNERKAELDAELRTLS